MENTETNKELTGQDFETAIIREYPLFDKAALDVLNYNGDTFTVKNSGYEYIDEHGDFVQLLPASDIEGYIIERYRDNGHGVPTDDEIEHDKWDYASHLVEYEVNGQNISELYYIIPQNGM